MEENSSTEIALTKKDVDFVRKAQEKHEAECKERYVRIHKRIDEVNNSITNLIMGHNETEKKLREEMSQIKIVLSKYLGIGIGFVIITEIILTIFFSGR